MGASDGQFIHSFGLIVSTEIKGASSSISGGTFLRSIRCLFHSSNKGLMPLFTRFPYSSFQSVRSASFQIVKDRDREIVWLAHSNSSLQIYAPGSNVERSLGLVMVENIGGLVRSLL